MNLNRESVLHMRRVVAMILLAIGLCALLGGCSASRLAYANGERLSYWWLDGYVDFDAGQGALVKGELASLFAWHRRSELPDYVQWLGTVEQRLARGGEVTPEQLRVDSAAIEIRFRRIAERAAPALARLVLTTRPEQIGSLQKKFDATNAVYRREHLQGDLQERQKKRFKKVMEQAEYWFGNFSAAQEAQISAASDARPLDAELVYADRLQRQASLVALVRRIQAERPAAEAAATLIDATLESQRRFQADPQRRAYFEAQQESSLALTALIINLTTPAQRAHAMQVVAKWRGDLRAMSSS